MVYSDVTEPIETVTTAMEVNRLAMFTMQKVGIELLGERNENYSCQYSYRKSRKDPAQSQCSCLSLAGQCFAPGLTTPFCINAARRRHCSPITTERKIEIVEVQSAHPINKPVPYFDRDPGAAGVSLNKSL